MWSKIVFGHRTTNILQSTACLVSFETNLRVELESFKSYEICLLKGAQSLGNY